MDSAGIYAQNGQASEIGKMISPPVPEEPVGASDEEPHASEHRDGGHLLGVEESHVDRLEEEE